MECIICEKPSSAKKISGFLCENGKPREITIGTGKSAGKYYEFVRKGKTICVVSAVGHLFTTEGKNPKNYNYPDFEYHWVPTYKNKETAFTKPYYDTIKQVASNASEYTIATDFDVEGEVIGYTILKNICGKTRANRMKYSCLTKPDIVASYEKKIPHLLEGKIQSGLARHEIDWLYGQNMSRALMKSMRGGGSFKSMGFGRVQGPALARVVKRELKIRDFKPEPYWQIQILIQQLGWKEGVICDHKKDRFTVKAECDAAFKKVQAAKTATVTAVEKRVNNVQAPHPFDLTSLQTEAYKCLGFTPNDTKNYAQNLYLASMISYPRTSSQKIPDTINCTAIIEKLAEQADYTASCNFLLNRRSGELRPRNGKKEDDAHPAIHPTGIFTTAIQKTPDESMRLYELIVRRFLATFGDPAKRESTTVDFDVNTEPFVTKGIVTVEPGWYTIYGRFAKMDETELPVMKKGEIIPIRGRELLAKETQPPARFTETSLIKDLEKHNLGTKSTRSEVIAKLLTREYIVLKDKALHATAIGISVIETCQKYAPEMCDETMTRNLEKEMEGIEAETTDKKKVMVTAIENLKKILDTYKSKEMDIGKELCAANNQAAQANVICTCKICGVGQLYVKKFKLDKFIGCTGYPNCRATYNIPKGCTVKPSGKTCEHCGFATITVRRSTPRAAKGEAKPATKAPPSKPYDMCFNKVCSSRTTVASADGTSVATSDIPEKNCPKCNNKMRVITGSSGPFYGCTGYPTCKTTLPVEDEKANADAPKCDKCSKPMRFRQGKFGPFYGCTGYPACKNIVNASAVSGASAGGGAGSGAPKERKAGPTCECGGTMYERNGQRGAFWGCSKYPTCKRTRPIDDDTVGTSTRTNTRVVPSKTTTTSAPVCVIDDDDDMPPLSAKYANMPSDSDDESQTVPTKSVKPAKKSASKSITKKVIKKKPLDKADTTTVTKKVVTKKKPTITKKT